MIHAQLTLSTKKNCADSKYPISLHPLYHPVSCSRTLRRSGRSSCTFDCWCTIILQCPPMHTHTHTHGRTPLCRWILTGQVYRLHCLHVDYVGTIVCMFRRCVKPPNEMLVLSSLQRKESEKCNKGVRFCATFFFFFFCESEGCSSSRKWKKESRRGCRRQMRGEDGENRRRRGKDYYHRASGWVSHP